MPLFHEPEITVTPLEDLILQMKCLGIDSVERFPFPTRPPPASLLKANGLLCNIGILHSRSRRVTHLGEEIAKLPINPRLGKIIVVAARVGIENLGIALAATLSEKDPFDTSSGQRVADETNDNQRNADECDEGDDDDDDDDDNDNVQNRRGDAAVLWKHSGGDALARLLVLGAYEFAAASANERDDDDDESVKRKADKTLQLLCEREHLHMMTLKRCSDLRRQLHSMRESSRGAAQNDFTSASASASASSSSSTSTSTSVPVLRPPSSSEELTLRQVMLTAYCDCIARRVPAGLVKTGSRRRRLTAYRSCDPLVPDLLYIHPNSSIYNSDPNFAFPEYVMYSALVKNQRGDTTYMMCVTPIDNNWIAELAE